MARAVANAKQRWIPAVVLYILSEENLKRRVGESWAIASAGQHEAGGQRAQSIGREQPERKR